MWSNMAASNLIEANSREVDVGDMSRTKAMSVNEITLKRNVEDLVNNGRKCAHTNLHAGVSCSSVIKTVPVLIL